MILEKAVDHNLYQHSGKNLNWGGSPSSSSSSSNTSSPLVSSSDLDRRVDWASMVDNVFREEIGKMAQGFRNVKY